MSHIDSLKCEEFLNNTDERFKKAEVKNFNVIHHKCIDDPLHKDLRTYQSVKKRSFWVQSTAKEKKNIISFALRCECKHISVEKTVTYEHFKSL